MTCETFPPGVSIRILRNTVGLTLQEAADASGLSKSYLARIEMHSHGVNPTTKLITHITRAILDESDRRRGAAA